MSQAPALVVVVAAITIVLSGRAEELARQLLDPGAAVLGLALGPVVFLLTLILLNGPGRGVQAWRAALAGLPRIPARRWLILLARSGYEEAFWRGTLQILLGPALIGVSCVAGAFTARHVYLETVNRRPRGWPRILEFLVFSLILGVSYALTQRLVIVIMIHWARNVLLEALTSSTRT